VRSTRVFGGLLIAIGVVLPIGEVAVQGARPFAGVGGVPAA
jgi:hypothetical protein